MFENKLIWPILVLLIGGLFWWFYFDKPLESKSTHVAYMGLNDRVEFPAEEYGRDEIGYAPGRLVKVDLLRGEVLREKELEHEIKRVINSDYDPERNRVYVVGRGLHSSYAKVYAEGTWADEVAPVIEVYDGDSLELIRTFDLGEGGYATRVRLTPNRENLVIRAHPSLRKNVDNSEREKMSWVLDAKTGKFIRGFGYPFKSSHFFNDDGSLFYGLFNIIEGEHYQQEAGRYVYSTIEDTLTQRFQDTQRLLKTGGLHPAPENSFKIPYPHFQGIIGSDLVAVYDRDTYEKIKEVDIKGQCEGDFDNVSLSGASDKQMSRDHRYRVYRMRVSEPKETKLRDEVTVNYLCVFDIENWEVANRIRVGGELSSPPVVH